MKKYSLYSIDNLSTVEALEPPFQATISVTMFALGGQVRVGLEVKSKDFLNMTINEIGELAYQEHIKTVKRALEE
ncbi:TPA: hypothetical protein ACKRET_003437 [Proteus mirabilis]